MSDASSSSLKLYPTQTAEEAIRLPSIQLSAQRAAVRAKEALILFAEATCKILIGPLHQERDGG